MEKTKQELELLNKYLPSRYYGHEARNNAILLARESKQLELPVMQKIVEEFENKFIYKYILPEDGWAWKNKDMHYNEIIEFIKTKLTEK